MAQAKALLVSVDGMSVDIVGRLLKEEPDCEIIWAKRDQLLEAIRKHEPTLVVMGLRDSDMGPGWDDLFLEYPRVQVLAVTPGGRRACLFREPLEEGLLTAVRESLR